MKHHAIITVRPPGAISAPQVGHTQSGDDQQAMAAALDLLGQHFAEYSAANPTFVLRGQWRKTYEAAIAQGIASGRHRLAIAVPGGGGIPEAAGVCACWLRSGTITEATTGVISELFVRPECRGMGVGRMLAEDACHWLLSNGAGELTLTTPVLGGAKPFWERLGFAVTSLGMTRFPVS